MNWEEKIIDYLHGQLSDEETLEVEKRIASDDHIAQMYHSYQGMFSEIDQEDMEQPSMRLAANFNQFLEKETQGNKVRRLNFQPFAIAASIILLVAVGVLLGLNISKEDIIDSKNQEIALLKSEMVHSLKDGSVSNRIEAINVSYDVQNPDKELEDILISSMSTDESANVRLAAVEALASMTTSTNVRENLILRLEQEEDSFVKIAIIQTLASMKEEKAVQNFDKIIQNESTPKFIKDEAHMAKLKITNI